MSKDFATKLKRLRKEAGITQEDLARVLGVGRTTVSEYERGVIEPKRKTLVDLAFYFGVPIDYFFIRDEIIKTNAELNKKLNNDIHSTIQDLISNLEYDQIPSTYKNKKLSEREAKIIVQMLENVIKIIELL